MNYVAKVITVPGGGYRVEGLMFHMPGRWEVVVEVRAGGKTERLVLSVIIE
jgi:hypothetical protein